MWPYVLTLLRYYAVANRLCTGNLGKNVARNEFPHAGPKYVDLFATATQRPRKALIRSRPKAAHPLRGLYTSVQSNRPYRTCCAVRPERGRRALSNVCSASRRPHSLSSHFFREYRGRKVRSDRGDRRACLRYPNLNPHPNPNCRLCPVWVKAAISPFSGGA